MGYRPYDPLLEGKRTWRSRLMVPGAIAALLLVVAAGTTLTVIGVMRLLDSPDAAEAGSGAPSAARNGRTATRSPAAHRRPHARAHGDSHRRAHPPCLRPCPPPCLPPCPRRPPPRSSRQKPRHLIAVVYERLVGSVVRITTGSDNVGIGQPYGEAGSGFVIDEDGHVLTNYHVIKDAKGLYVTLDDGTPLTARVVGTDPGSDVALLKANIPATKLVVAPLGFLRRRQGRRPGYRYRQPVLRLRKLHDPRARLRLGASLRLLRPHHNRHDPERRGHKPAAVPAGRSST